MNALIFDCETSGLIDNHSVALDQQPSVIEFYCCSVDLATGIMSYEYETLVKPPKPIDAKITSITTITNEMLKDALPFTDVADKIKLQLESTGLLIAHNASFDKEILDLEFERLGQKIIWPRVCCTVEATVHLSGYRLTQSALHQLLFNEPFAGAHRAKADCAALTRICVELFKRGEL